MSKNIEMFFEIGCNLLSLLHDKTKHFDQYRVIGNVGYNQSRKTFRIFEFLSLKNSFFG